MLKLLTRILQPTRGRCEVRGRAGALIEVAAGFHPDLTGRENVFLQGAIMGMKRAEIAGKFDEIVEFAGVSEFIDTPVKRYSSGMNARLGFAIAAHLDPDVLLIDEVLSVGDAAFQDKCVERMRELIDTRHPAGVHLAQPAGGSRPLHPRDRHRPRHGAVRRRAGGGDPAVPAGAMGTPAAAAADQPQSSRSASAAAELLNERGEPAAVFHTDGRMRIRIALRGAATGCRIRVRRRHPSRRRRATAPASTR